MKQDSKINISSSPFVLTVPDLTEAIEFFTQRLGFCLEMIVPADAPQAAVISGQGIALRLVCSEVQTATVDSSLDEQEFIISRMNTGDAWHVGRAGMQYRDLIPSRLGGRFIASHIRIPEGGETPDYVHYHKVRFQMIYCKAGWVRVVYEDQGPPFVLEAGDCVLQPPEIRHRVLASSPGLEVIEVSCPAIHETWVEHEIKLPTSEFSPARLFNGQHFVRHRAREATWEPWRLEGFNARDTGIAAATKGLAAVQVVKAASAVKAKAISHAGEILFLFLLNGELGLDSQANGNYQLQAGDSCVIPTGADYTLHASTELEMLEVILTASS